MDEISQTTDAASGSAETLPSVAAPKTVRAKKATAAARDPRSKKTQVPATLSPLADGENALTGGSPKTKRAKSLDVTPKPPRARKPSARKKATPNPIATPQSLVVEAALPVPATPTRASKAHVPPHGRRALALAMHKAAKFRVQVALASSLDQPAPVATEEVLSSSSASVPASKRYLAPTGQRALALAMRKAAKFRAQVDPEEPASPPASDALPAITEAAPLPTAMPAVLHPARAKKVLSSPRGQRALELAMRKAAEAKAAAMPAAPVAPVTLPSATLPVRTGYSRRFVPTWRQSKRWTVTALALSAIVLAVGTVGFLRHRRERVPKVTLAKPRPSLEWLRQAQDRAADGSFRLALNTVDRALVDSPDNAALLKFKGDMHQSLFQFGAAQNAYQQALNIHPQTPEAQENLVLSRRLNRSAKYPAGRRSMLYGLHRAMLAQGRLGEAVAISNQLASDPVLAQSTWQATLERAGLHGRVEVDSDGELSLDLSGNARPDLTLIQKFPVRRLNLANTGVDDLSPLRGLPLEALDLSSTPVYDLASLHGMPLTTLNLARTGAVDLTVLKGCPLRELDISGTRVAGVDALAGMPLVSLRADDTPITDLGPLAACPLVRLSLSYTRVSDLRPLQNLGLEELNLEGTNTADLAPLKGSPLRTLSLAFTPVRDLTPLADAPLTVLTLQGCPNVKDLRPLLSCSELEHLALPSNRVRLDALHKLPRLRFIEGDDLAAKGH